jgi:hypothetical protein
MHRLLLASLVAAGVSSVSLSALAQTGAPTVATTRPTSNPSYADTGDALDPTGWSVAALLGFGVNNGVGIGIGARGGYTLDNHVYIGGTLIDHLPSGLNILLLGGEAGYDFEVGPVVIRAYGGLGFANASVSVGGVSASSTNVAFWPGGTVIYNIPSAPQWFVGGDARVYIVSDFNTLALYGFGGIHF